MKKMLLSIVLASCSTAAANELYNGRIAGMSGAGYVTSNYSDGLLLNPSLAAAHGETDNFSVVINGGALGSDKDDLIDSMEELVDYTDYLSGITDVADLDPTMADTLIDHINRVANKHIRGVGGASLVVTIPNDIVSVALVAKAYGTLGATTLVSESDYELINNAVNSPFDPEDLESSVIGKGAFIKEIGVALAKSIATTNNRSILLGITPKKVTVETLVYETTVAEYDEDDLDADNYTVESSATSLDAGITYNTGGLLYGLTVTDVISKEFKTVTAEKFELSPKTTAAVGYSKDWLTAEMAMDLNATPAFGLGGETKIIRAGLEIRPFTWLQLRTGLQRDLEDTLTDTYSLGLGISPFNVVNLDVAVITGKNETKGGAIQLGLRF